MAVSNERLSNAACDCTGKAGSTVQRILVFQQCGSGEKKIKGIRDHGGPCFILETLAIDESLPPLLDDATELLPETLEADLVLDFLLHPDLSQDLAHLCERLGIPVVASGKKWRGQGVFSPPT